MSPMNGVTDHKPLPPLWYDSSCQEGCKKMWSCNPSCRSDERLRSCPIHGMDPAPPLVSQNANHCRSSTVCNAARSCQSVRLWASSAHGQDSRLMQNSCSSGKRSGAAAFRGFPAHAIDTSTIYIRYLDHVNSTSEGLSNRTVNTNHVSVQMRSAPLG